MDMSEYLSVRDMTYQQYCDFLQNKYGIGVADYFTKSFNVNPKCKRTSEGLIAHHKMEDRAPLLSNKKIAREFPFEWQEKNNIVYCDYLEHLLLHVLICKYPCNDASAVGIGGIAAYIVPELNDLYSGWETKQTWRKNCHDKVVDDIDVYLAILKQFFEIMKDRNQPVDNELLCRSFNSPFGNWDESNNKNIYEKILEL